MNTAGSIPRGRIAFRPASRSGGIGPFHHGYTLVELMLALPIMALLTLGLSSAIKIAGNAVPDGTSTSSAALTTSRALEAFAEDVGFATAVTSDVNAAAAARQVTFSLPDRDGIAPATETVTYSWSGVAGAPLLRTFNGVTTTVAANVQEFQLNYDKRAVPVVTTTSGTSAETLLISSDGSSSSNDYTITSGNWCGQYFLPVLAANVTGWNVTKIQIRARKNGSSTGVTNVQIRTASNLQPTSTVLGQTTMQESGLSSNYALKTFNISNVPLQPTSQGLCLVLQLASGSPAGDVQYWAGGNPVTSNLVWTGNSGTTWSSSTGNSLRYYVYGTVETQSTSTTYQYLLSNVRCTLRTGAAVNSRMQTSIRVLNEPQITGP